MPASSRNGGYTARQERAGRSGERWQHRSFDRPAVAIYRSVREGRRPNSLDDGSVTNMAGRSGREVGSDDPPVQSPPQYHPCPIASSNSAPLFLGEFTCLLTGQTFSTSPPAGCNSVAASTSTSPNHADQSCGSRITGIRS